MLNPLHYIEEGALNMKITIARFILACTLIMLMLNSAYAADVWTGYTRIDKLDVQDTFCFAWLEGNDGCNGKYRLNADSQNYDEKLLLLMSAFFEGFKVNIKYSDTGACEPPIVKVRARQ